MPLIADPVLTVTAPFGDTVATPAIDSAPRTTFTPLTLIIPLAAIADAEFLVLAPDTVVVAVLAIADAPFVMRAPAAVVVAEAAIALDTCRITPAVLDVAEVVEMAVSPSLTLCDAGVTVAEADTADAPNFIF